jgi:hypothetical protein
MASRAEAFRVAECAVDLVSAGLGTEIRLTWSEGQTVNTDQAAN